MTTAGHRMVCYDHDCLKHAYRDPECGHTACTQAPYQPWMKQHHPVFTGEWPGGDRTQTKPERQIP